MKTTASVERLQAIKAHISNHPIITFIGGGNMAEAILCGLQASGHPGAKLRYTEPLDERRAYMQKKYPAMVGSIDNLKAVNGADIVILAVKPQVLKKVISSCANQIPQHALIISIAAGITTQDMHRWMGSERPLVRCMPNTPSLVGEGAAGLYATKGVDQVQRTMAETVMRAVAKQVLWVTDEILIDVVTGISGSGPAYFFLVLEAMRKSEFW